MRVATTVDEMRQNRRDGTCFKEVTDWCNEISKVNVF